MKCNLCTFVCPMMEVNPFYPGPKKAGPDGERYRLMAPEFYDYALKYCLNCKRCEISCPSDVKVGDIIQRARLKYAGHNLRDYMLASTDLVGILASPFAPVLNPVLRSKTVKGAMHLLAGVDSRRTFPSYSSRKFTSWYRKNVRDGFIKGESAPTGKFVSFFHGCYVNYNYPRLGEDLLRLVNAAGYGVRLLEKERCCGVALISNSFGSQARRQAIVNLDSMRKAVGRGEDIITVSSTCTFTMRDEYSHVLDLENSDVRPHLMLLSKWLYGKIESGEVQLKFNPDFRLRVAYHTACHMQKLGWRNYTLELLKLIPGVELVELPQNCCGIAGTFGFKKENYRYSQTIGDKLFTDIRLARGPQELESDVPFVVCTECETCKWQIEMSTGIPVLNPVSILASALFSSRQ